MITSLNRSEVSSKTDYLETVNSVSKTYLSQKNASSTSTLTITNGLQSEIAGNTAAITTLQEELISLGIAGIINGVFSFTSQIISTSVLAAEIENCMKLKGQNDFTGNTTSGNDTYTFYGANPS